MDPASTLDMPSPGRIARMILCHPALRRDCDRFVDGLSSGFEDVRQEAVATLRAEAGRTPWVLGLFIDRLVMRLRCWSPGIRVQAMASLADFGVPSAAALVLALSSSHSARMRPRFVEALVVVGQQLRPEERLALAQELRQLATASRDMTLAEACLSVIRALPVTEEGVYGLAHGDHEATDQDTAPQTCASASC
jgi:hypothetical protein